MENLENGNRAYDAQENIDVASEAQENIDVASEAQENIDVASEEYKEFLDSLIEEKRSLDNKIKKFIIKESSNNPSEESINKLLNLYENRARNKQLIELGEKTLLDIEKKETAKGLEECGYFDRKDEKTNEIINKFEDELCSILGSQ